MRRHQRQRPVPARWKRWWVIYWRLEQWLPDRAQQLLLPTQMLLTQVLLELMLLELPLRRLLG